MTSSPKKPGASPKKSSPPPTPVVPKSVIEAVRREVALLPLSLQGSALALTALHLGEVLTSTDSARDAATIVKELRATLADLSAAVGSAIDKADAVDEIKRQRDKRRLKVGM